jgi:subtilase-type serine protease
MSKYTLGVERTQNSAARARRTADVLRLLVLLVVVFTNGYDTRSAQAQSIVATGDVNPAVPAPPPDVWNVGGSLFVGQTGSGTLTITEGAVVRDANGFVGQEPGSIGVATVSGAGSTWTDVGSLFVGNFGTGTLSLTEGGTASSRDGFVGDNAGSVGVAMVSGVGSHWTNSGDLFIATSGVGTLLIEDGGSVTSEFGYVALDTSGNGRVTVSGAGSTWTNGAVLSIGDSGSGILNIQNGGTVSSDFSSIGNFAGGIGSVLVSGTGSTFTNSSALSVGNGGSGTLTLVQGASVSVQGGAGSLGLAVFAGSSGTINLGAASLNSGDATEAGRLDVARVEFGDGAGTLNFNHAGSNYDFAPVLVSAGAGTHKLNHLTGITTLSGDSADFSGTTTVAGGTLIVTNQLGGTLTVGSGATLQGTGRVGTTSLQGGATIDPGDGDGIGTLSVAGDLTFAPGAIYRVEVDPNSTASDRIAVTGTANLAGSVVHVGPDSDFTSTRQYTVLTASAVQGQFAAVRSNFAFLDPTLLYSTQDVILLLARKQSGGAFVDAAQTYNQRATASALDSLPASSPLHEYIVTLPSGAPPAIFDSLSGELHASIAAGLLGSSAASRTLPLAHLRNRLLDTEQPTSNAPVWTELVGNWQTLQGDGNAAEFKQRSHGLFVGADRAVGNGWRMGGALGYTAGDISVDDRESKAYVSNYSATLFGGKSSAVAMGTLNLLLGAAYTWHDIDTRRYTSVTGAPQKLKADYSASSSQLFTELGYAIPLSPRTRIEPFAGLAWSDLRTRGFSESGGSAALSGQSASDKQTSSTLGVRGQADFLLGQAKGQLHGTLGWQHAFNDEITHKTMAFAGSQAFTVAGAPIARDAALAELGADVALTSTTTLGLNYSGQYGDGSRDHAGMLTLCWSY